MTIDHVPIDQAGEYAGEAADLTLRLWRLFSPRLAAEHMSTVYETLERPLVGVLAGMERAGVKVDRGVLSRLSGYFAQGMARLEDEIYELAGERFNIASPKQLGEILFDDTPRGQLPRSLMANSYALVDQEIFLFEKVGITEDGKVLGRFRATGVRPKCCEHLKTAGVHLPPAIFEGVTEVR